MNKIIKKIFLLLILPFCNYLFFMNFPRGDYLVKEIKIFSKMGVLFIILGIIFNFWSFYTYKRQMKAYEYFNKNIRDEEELKEKNRQKYAIAWVIVPVVLYTLNRYPIINDNIYLYLKGWIITYFYPWSLLALSIVIIIGNTYLFLWLSNYKVIDYICPYFFITVFYKIEIFFRENAFKKSKLRNNEKSILILKLKIAFYLEKSVYFNLDCKDEIEKKCQQLLRFPLKEEDIFLVETVYELLGIVHDSINKEYKFENTYSSSKEKKSDEYFYTLEKSEKNRSIPHIIRKYIIYKSRGYKEYCNNFIPEILRADINIFNKNYNEPNARFNQALVKYANIFINGENK